MEKNKSKFKRLLPTIILTVLCLVVMQTILYFCLRKNLTIVLYKTEVVQEQIAADYTEEYTVAYFRLNTKDNHKLAVKNFSIFSSNNYDNKFKWQKAFKVEYFDQTITTTFETYPNQPILKVYFDCNAEDTGSVVFVKYKDTEMRIGEFAKER